jgi:hypothetical protein
MILNTEMANRINTPVEFSKTKLHFTLKYMMHFLLLISKKMLKIPISSQSNVRGFIAKGESSELWHSE